MKILNLDKMQYIEPSSFGEARDVGITGTALLFLTSNPFKNMPGRSAHSSFGSWAGDRIVTITKDTEDGDIPGVHGAGSLWDKCVKRTMAIGGQRVPTQNKGEFKNIGGWIRDGLEEVDLFPQNKTVILDAPTSVKYGNQIYDRRLK